MDNFYFWKNWTKEYKLFFTISCFLLFVSIVFFIVSGLSSLDFIQSWGSIQQLTTIPIDFHQFTNHYHEFKIEIINYLIYEKYTSILVTLNPTLGLFYVSIVFIAFTLFLTYSTTLSKYLFYASIMASMVFLATLNFDLLEIFTSNNKAILTICVIIYGGTSYIIYHFLYQLKLTQRFFIFLFINALLITFIFKASPLENAHIYYHIAGYSSASTIILTALFILYVSIENTLFLSFLNSNNNKGSLPIYILLNLLYIGVLIAKLFFNISVYGLNEYTLFITATIFTIWGTLKRNEDNKLGDTVARILVTITLATVSLTTLAFHFSNQNSPITSVFQKEIFICFLGYGGIFFAYVLVNFIGQVHAKMNVYRFIFKPKDFTAFRMYMIGTIASIVLFTYKYNKRPYYQALSGYYNGVADAYYIKNDLMLAEPFYEHAKFNDPFNNKSNIFLANLAIKKENLPKAIEHYVYATTAEGSEQAYLQLANIYKQRGDYFDAHFTLKKGVKKHPKSYRLWNNLGILSKESSLSDSTVYYFSKSINYAPKNEYTPVNNLITFLLKKGFLNEGKELIETIDIENQDIKTKASIAAYNAKNGIFNQWNKQSFKVDSSLSNAELAFLYNHFINNINLMDSSDLQVLDSTLDAPNNIFNYEPITTLKAFYEFYNGSPKVAREHLATLGGGTSFYSGYYNNLLGLWLMMHENYNLANTYLSIANRYNFKGAKFNHAFTESIVGNYDIADSIWNELGDAGKGYKNIIHNQIDSLTDFEKLISLTFGNQQYYDDFLRSSENHQISSLMKLERIKFLITQNKVDDANSIFKELKSENNEIIENMLSLIEAEINIHYQKYNEALQILSKNDYPLELKAKHLNLSALASEKLEDNEQAEKIYRVLVHRYPFYEKGLLNYISYLEKQNKQNEAYQIAVQGVKSLNNSLELRKKYTLLCIDEGLIGYAASSLIELQQQMNSKDFSFFKTIYDEKYAKFESKFKEWE